MKHTLFILSGLLFFSCSEREETSDPITVKKEKSAPEFSMKAIYNDSIGWGYQVFYGSKIKINQEHVPAVQGIQGFDTQEKAEIAANYVMERMKAGEQHPRVTPAQLDSIGAIDLKQ